VPLLHRGAVLGQLESSRHAAQRPLEQNGALDGHVEASAHCMQWPRWQRGSAGSRQSLAPRHSTHSPVAELQ
jgi:hypothetical protein